MIYKVKVSRNKVEHPEIVLGTPVLKGLSMTLENKGEITLNVAT